MTRSLLLLISISSLVSPLLAQGPLIPPGAPAPVMKSLDQIEPRTAVQSLATSPPYTISQPGSYYLTGNISVANGDGIQIRASGVTLDLGGFIISSQQTGGASGTGVLIGAGVNDCRVHNGAISGKTTVTDSSTASAGFTGGIAMEAIVSGVTRVQVDDVRVRGIAGTGISIAQGTASRCTVSSSESGVAASYAFSCSADNIRYHAISGSIEARDCHGISLSSGDGIKTSKALDCTGSSSAGNGVTADMASNCVGTSNSGAGVRAPQSSNCRGTSTSGTGLAGDTVSNSYGLSTSGVGLSAVNASNSMGYSTSSDGVSVTNAVSCRGGSSSAAGIRADTATGCKGVGGAYGLLLVSGDNCSGVNEGYGPGIQAENVTNCKGISNGVGLRVFANATNCYGKALGDLGQAPAGVTQIGIWADGTATSCRGDHAYANGIALKASIAVGCTAAQGSISSPSKQLGTP